jgi:hypothetical protein
MRYVKPELRSLTGGPTGYCVDGDSAAKVPECTNGPGISYPYCTAGQTAAERCENGEVAGDGINKVWEPPDCRAGMNADGIDCVSGTGVT